MYDSINSYNSDLNKYYMEQIRNISYSEEKGLIVMESTKLFLKEDKIMVELLQEYDPGRAASGVYFGCRIQNRNSKAKELINTMILEFKDVCPNYVPLEDDGSSEDGSEWLVWYRVKDDDIQQGLEDLNKLKELFKAHGFTESALV